MSDMLRFSTAGESHGESLVALVSGLPAGIPVDQTSLDRELWRRGPLLGDQIGIIADLFAVSIAVFD